MNEMEWREPTTQEKSLIDLVLSASFTGRDVIANQIRNTRVRVIDGEGSIAFDVTSPEKAAVKHRIPVEAEAPDSDGVMVHMLLHVVDGRASELEFYKDDSTPILKLPPARQWTLIQLHG